MATSGDQPPGIPPDQLRSAGETAAMRAIEWSVAVREGRAPEPHTGETAIVDALTGIYFEIWRLADLLAPTGTPARRETPRRPSGLQSRPGPGHPERRLLGWNMSYSHGFVAVYGTDEEATGFIPDFPA